MNMLFGLNQYNEFYDDEHPLNEFYITGFRPNRINQSSNQRSTNNSLNGLNEESAKNSIMSDTEIENLNDFQILKGHTSDVNAVDISSNNELILSGSNDRTVRVWKMNRNGIFKENTTDPPFISPITEHSYGINVVRFSPFSTMVATAATDGKINLWTTQTGNLSFTLYHPSEAAIRCLSFSPNSEMLATGK